ncbi:MAG: lipoyl(octanoyl) transferase LipB [Acidobacteria bacterium]|nr:lipoyl(octanoyl) transferase LipB [Acidobacteriota bacterium]NIM63628.1 lipoyl(octanoyl) transferase LipB [Acidobacteriota bacterium]NIO59198.1 lipoyl(octanoyl) transferase LipB [Acidobacteriota bacterium]NIQ30225.1 lipoyl(octanoyl) transferase LipB [Acidobacteriota bacterium]NIQ85153.1 lipoyl(octanoyl) transferase LipB [Acidobacteriota bacterium]
MGTRLHVRWLGRVDYRAGLTLQERLIEGRRRDTHGDTLLLLEHPPVITLGRNSDPAHVLHDERELARRGVELHEIGRGGDVTYHGPGQLVGYPVVRLEGSERDAHAYLRNLELGLIRIAGHYGVEARRVEGLTGIWVGDEKLAAIGVRLSTGWITSHGFALNVTTDLEGFSTIVPCGIRGRGVTSLARLLGRKPELEEVARVAAREIARALNRSAGPLGDITDLPAGVSWKPDTPGRQGDHA